MKLEIQFHSGLFTRRNVCSNYELFAENWIKESVVWKSFTASKFIKWQILVIMKAVGGFWNWNINKTNLIKNFISHQHYDLFKINKLIKINNSNIESSWIRCLPLRWLIESPHFTVTHPFNFSNYFLYLSSIFFFTF